MERALRRRSRRRLVGLILAPLAVAVCAIEADSNGEGPPAGCHATWAPSVRRPIPVQAGRARFEVPCAGGESETLVVVSALSRSPGPFPVEVRVRPANRIEPLGPSPPPLEVKPLPIPPSSMEDLGPPPSQPPPRSRVFHLMVGEGDAGNLNNYQAVRGMLRAFGRWVQVYVAEEDLRDVSGELLEDLVSTFDQRVYPDSVRSYGQAYDVDGDGRFTILLSSWLSRLGNGRQAIDGFVRVTDLDPAFPTPFGNHCDMIYLNARLKAGPYARTILVHEYLHAVIFSRKLLQGAANGLSTLEEESWLDEGLAHLVEDRFRFSRSNLDYRVSTFLSSPERYRLVVEDYHAADLFRSHGNRGSTFLFLRWCVDRFGPGLIPALVGSRLRGIANLEEATGCSFEELYREWSLALFLSGLAEPGPGDAKIWGYRSLNLRQPFQDWELAGPRPKRVVPGGAPDRWSAAGTSSHYVLIEPGPWEALEVTVTGPAAAELQVTALVLPPRLPRLELTGSLVRDSHGELCLLAAVREQGGVPVHLSALAWEPLEPASDLHCTGFQRGQLDTAGLVAAFGTTKLSAWGRLQAQPIPLPGVHAGDGPLIIKVLGVDAQGRKIAGWTEIDLGSGLPWASTETP